MVLKYKKTQKAIFPKKEEIAKIFVYPIGGFSGLTNKQFWVKNRASIT